MANDIGKTILVAGAVGLVGLLAGKQALDIGGNVAEGVTGAVQDLTDSVGGVITSGGEVLSNGRDFAQGVLGNKPIPPNNSSSTTYATTRVPGALDTRKISIIDTKVPKTIPYHVGPQTKPVIRATPAANAGKTIRDLFAIGGQQGSASNSSKGILNPITPYVKIVKDVQGLFGKVF